MKRYQSYKPSGVEWIGDIPVNWNLLKLKHEYKIQKGRIPKTINEKEEKGSVPYLSMEVLRGSETLSYVSKEDGVFVKEGQILILWDGSNSGEIIKVVNEGIMSSTMGVLNKVGDKLHEDFSFYQLKSHEPEIRNNTNGMGIPHVDGQYVRSLVLLTPPINEQEQIVKFLDEKTSIIDKLISTKERKIELLKEQRISLINELITKGLDPNVKMKDSGVEWIGEIPEHWKMKKLKYIFQIRKRISGELGYDVLSITQKGVKIKDIESGKGQVSMDYTKYQIVEVGDFTMNHMDLLTGFIDISPYKGVTSPDYRVFSKTDEKSNSKYYLSLFQFGYTNKVFYGFGQGSSMFGRWRLPSIEFNNFKLPYPSLEEQNKIVDFLEKQTKEIDDLVHLEQKKIETLKEYRQSLISEVITGKIKVSNE